ncbi:hypothetical protein K4749_29650 [Streptomyces sp. TRM72054]|uniref:hypothetical protein n=1 Tax=Streptomyces sp. TRM72054 TaxID=2870562 RepID=UPI001C8CA9BE|nr:hypothetical protein [Streptomyces sp. TRM72054]MBX9397641.1 hypothetical protein [Streptomyces sp. TRM72054]
MDNFAEFLNRNALLKGQDIESEGAILVGRPGNPVLATPAITVRVALATVAGAYTAHRVAKAIN